MLVPVRTSVDLLRRIKTSQKQLIVSTSKVDVDMLKL